jgi:hypothetical protein
MIKKLLKLIRAELKPYKIKLYIGKGKSVQYNSKLKVNGYFDNDGEKLAVAKNIKNWELVLVHEFAHFKQWAEDCAVWQDYIESQEHIGLDDLSDKNSDATQDEINKSALATMLMERDCEMRAYALLKELGYPKNKLMEYIQKSNAYTIFYLFLAKHRTWYTIGKEPYNLKSIWSKFPKTFSIDPQKTFNRLEYLYKGCVKK